MSVMGPSEAGGSEQPEKRGRQRRRRVLIVAGVVVLLAGAVTYRFMLAMPGQSFRGPLPPRTEPQARLAERLRGDVVLLTETIGQRNIWHPENYARAAEAIHERFEQLGYTVTRHVYQVEGQECANIIAERPGTAEAEGIVIIAAHYDSVFGTVGANDNASGVAALLAIAEAMKDVTSRRTLRLIAFANEEPPFFHTDQMGSVVYARQCRQRGEDIIGVVSLDGLGYYRDEPGSQQYPFPFSLLYPSTGNFIAFVSNFGSYDLLRQCVGSFRQHAQFPSEGGAGPEAITGIGWSDHWSFWQAGYKGVMVTDTLPFRYPYYHSPQDTPDKLDYDRLARVTEGLVGVTRDLLGKD